MTNLESLDASDSPAFPCGLVVYLRTIVPQDGALHRVPFPSGRNVVHENPSDVWYQIYDATNSVIGIFHVDAISFIISLPPEVPSDKEQSLAHH